MVLYKVVMSFRNFVNLGHRELDQLHEMYKWCEASVGKRYHYWNRVHNFHGPANGSFRFRYKKDETMFRLRWS